MLKATLGLSEPGFKTRKFGSRVHLFMILTCSQCSIHPIILKNDRAYFSGKNRNQKEMPSKVPTRKNFSCPGLIYIPPNFLLSHRRNCSSTVEKVQHLHLCFQSSLLSPLLEYCSLLEFLFLWDLQLILLVTFSPEALEVLSTLTS